MRLRDLGFRQFKAFVQAAETRGVVETKVEKLDYYVRRVGGGPQEAAAEAPQAPPGGPARVSDGRPAGSRPLYGASSLCSRRNASIARAVSAGFSIIGT